MAAETPFDSSLEPIGVFSARARHPYEARRQAVLDESGDIGVVELAPGRGFEQALEDLQGFERIWLLYLFDRNRNWKPKVLPPRGPRVKRGVFSTRAPYRPNPIGLSCVRLRGIEGLQVFVEGHDLLDGTPILDIKPYVPYADAFPDSRCGWLEGVDSRAVRVSLAGRCEEQLSYLESRGVEAIRGFLRSQLEFEPLDDERKRVFPSPRGGDRHVIAYRTWRAEFRIEPSGDALEIERVFSAYRDEELAPGAEDRWADKDLHRDFKRRFEDDAG